MASYKSTRHSRIKKSRTSDNSSAWVGRVVIAQWGLAYAEALQTHIQKAFPNARTQISCTGSETVAILRDQPADMLFLTMSFADMDGIDLLNIITEEKLATHVLVGCRRRDEHCLQWLRNARFDGIVDTLEESLETLIEAIQVVTKGEAYVSPTFRGIVVDRVAPSELWQQLTLAEIRILSLIGDGSDDREVAERIGLSAATVQTHRRNIMRKLNISSSAKLVREAIRLGLVRITDSGNIIRPGFDAIALAVNTPANDSAELLRPTGST